MNEEATVLSTHTPAFFQAAVVRAVDLLKAGQVVALPTETVYGLAANALDPQAVASIFTIKERPELNPIIVHVASVAMAKECTSEWPLLADRLAKAFWPGPLTIVLSKAEVIPSLVTAGGPTVGVRWPRHAFMQAVIRACGFPLAAPSANLSNQLSPTSAEHVRKSLGKRIPLIVDCGPSEVGIESTVIDLSVSSPKILRPGMIHRESLLAVTGSLSGVDTREGVVAPLKSPGQLPKHYAPTARLEIWHYETEKELTRRIAATGYSNVHVIAHSRIPAQLDSTKVTIVPHDAEAFARALYAELHRCDDEGADLIVVEALPEAEEWHPIADRLRRATSK